MFRPDPERVKLTTEELSAVIKETQKSIDDLEDGEEDGKENVEASANSTKEKVEKKEKTEEDIMAEYGLDDYDEEEEGGEAPLLGLGDLTSFANPSVCFPHSSYFLHPNAPHASRWLLITYSAGRPISYFHGSRLGGGG